MNIFDKWLYLKLRDMWDNRHKYDDAVYPVNKLEAKMATGAALSIGSERPSIDSNGFNIKVYRATGGTIIETRKYDTKRDSSNTGLYIITDDKDLGEEIGKIITMEGLKA